MAVRCSRYIVYALSDPYTGEIRYVGKSTSGMTRPARHYAAAWRLDYPEAKWRVYRWIRSLEGIRPLVEVVEETTSEALQEAEMFWISQFRGLGFRLTNMTDGGEGCLGRATSPKAKRRASEVHSGKTVSEEARIKSSRSHGGRPFVDQFGIVYQTVQGAAKTLGISSSTNISAVLYGKRRTAAGRTFKYLE